jgi:hypothetical protein
VEHMTGTPEQERALGELIAPADRQLYFRGHETDNIADGESTTVITAWVGTNEGASGLFRIDPNGVVSGAFEMPDPPYWRSM